MNSRNATKPAERVTSATAALHEPINLPRVLRSPVTAHQHVEGRVRYERAFGTWIIAGGKDPIAARASEVGRRCSLPRIGATTPGESQG